MALGPSETIFGQPIGGAARAASPTAASRPINRANGTSGSRIAISMAICAGMEQRVPQTATANVLARPSLGMAEAIFCPAHGAALPAGARMAMAGVAGYGEVLTSAVVFIPTCSLITPAS